MPDFIIYLAYFIAGLTLLCIQVVVGGRIFGVLACIGAIVCAALCANAAYEMDRHWLFFFWPAWLFVMAVICMLINAVMFVLELAHSIEMRGRR